MFSPSMSMSNNEHYPSSQQQQPQANCMYHAGCTVTNFCRLPTCLMPLCPKCIPTHLEKHRQQGQHAELETVDQMHEETTIMISTQLQNLNNALAKLGRFKEAKSDAHGQLHEMLTHARQRVQRVVDAFFDQLLTDLENVTVQDRGSLDSEIQNTEQSVLSKINDLRDLEQKLKTPKFLKHIVNLLGSNYIQQLQQHTIECDAYIDEISKRTLDIQIDDSKLYSINIELAKYISIKNADYYKSAHPTTATKQHPYLQKSQIASKGVKEFETSSQLQPQSTTNFFVNVPDYYEPLTQFKFMHFVSERSIYIYQLDQKGSQQQWQEVIMSCAIPIRSTSLRTPQGDIYIIGGYNGSQLSGVIWRVDLKSKSLIQVDSLQIPRHSASAIYANSRVYVVGGQSQTEDLTSIEYLELHLAKSKTYNSNKQQLPRMQYGGPNLSLCAFRQQYIVKVTPLEVFDYKSSQWAQFNINISKNVGLVQINNSNILILGAQYGQLKKLDTPTLQFSFEQLTNDPKLQNVQNSPLVHSGKVYVVCNRQLAIGSADGWYI